MCIILVCASSNNISQYIFLQDKLNSNEFIPFTSEPYYIANSPCSINVHWIQSLSTANYNVYNDNAVLEGMVGKKQMDYRFQPGFNCLEDKFSLNTKIASRITEFHIASSLALAWHFVHIRTPHKWFKITIRAPSPLTARITHTLSSLQLSFFTQLASYTMREYLHSFSFNFFTFMLSLCNNLCTKMVTSCKLLNLGHMMKILFKYMILKYSATGTSAIVLK